MPAILVIQTAFIGDAILASSLVETLHRDCSNYHIDLVVRKGNEGLYAAHPFLREVLVWDKKQHKYKNLSRLRKRIRAGGYEKVINLQRFAASGWLTWRSGAQERIGFDKNPMAFGFTRKIKHDLDTGKHEVERNHALVAHFVEGKPARPRLYPSPTDRQKVEEWQTGDYITVSPTSVWFTKQWAADQWVKFISRIPKSFRVYALGGPADRAACEEILGASGHDRTVNLAGKLSLLQSAVLMQGAQMNYVNDSAPQHLASAMNAPVTTIYCSTIPAFGFGPLSDRSFVIETNEQLDCRPCGLHGFKSCPKGHFNCSRSIDPNQVLATMNAEN